MELLPHIAALSPERGFQAHDVEVQMFHSGAPVPEPGAVEGELTRLVDVGKLTSWVLRAQWSIATSPVEAMEFTVYYLTAEGRSDVEQFLGGS